MSESTVPEEHREDIAAALGPLMEEDVEDLRQEDLEHAMEAMDAVRSRAASKEQATLVRMTEYVKEQVRHELTRRQAERVRHDEACGRQR